VIAVELSRKEIRHFNAILGETLKVQLHDEGVSERVIIKFLAHLYQPEISKTKNRSIIGTAVDYERLIHSHVEYSPVYVQAKTQTELSIKLARTPILAMKPDPFPYKVFSAELFKRYGDTGHFDYEPIPVKPYLLD
jgi:hypothetical protein